MLTTLRYALVLALAAAGAGACGDDNPAAPTPGPVAIGTWGGDTSGVIVDATSTHVHIKCTLGDIPQRFAAASDGTFDVAGTYVLRAYPVLLGPELPARFSGVIEGNRMTLTVTVDDTTQNRVVTLGPVRVRLGQEPQMANCPICRSEDAAEPALAPIRGVVRYIVTLFRRNIAT